MFLSVKRKILILSQGALASFIYLFFSCVWAICVCMLLLQLCSILYDPMDGSLPVSSIHWVSQERILERVARPSFRGSSQPRESESPVVPVLPVDSLLLSHRGSPRTILSCFFACFIYYFLFLISEHVREHNLTNLGSDLSPS